MDAAMPNQRHANVPDENAAAPTPPATLSRHAAGDPVNATAIKCALIASGTGAAVAVMVYSLSASGSSLYTSVASLF
jgi:hypothetical protein